MMYAWMLGEDLFVKTHDDGSHYVAFLEILFCAGGMGIVAGDAGIRDGEVGCHPFKLLAVFEGQNPCGRIGRKLLQRRALLDAPPAIAVAPKREGRWEPFFARYDARLAGAVVRCLLEPESHGAGFGAIKDLAWSAIYWASGGFAFGLFVGAILAWKVARSGDNQHPKLATRDADPPFGKGLL